jgi:hypothetical protein
MRVSLSGRGFTPDIHHTEVLHQRDWESISFFLIVAFESAQLIMMRPGPWSTGLW